MGSGESRFYISLIVGDEVTKQCPAQTAYYEERGEPKQTRTEVLLLLWRNSVPLGQTGLRPPRHSKDVGTPASAKQLVYSSNCCFNRCAEQSHEDSVRKAAVEEQLSSKTNRPATRAQLHLLALDLAWALNSPALHSSSNVAYVHRDRKDY